MNQQVQRDAFYVVIKLIVYGIVYDHGSIQIGKTINATDVIQYVVNTNRPYAQVPEERRTHGLFSSTRQYVYGNERLSRTTEDMTYYYHYDGMGNVRALSDMNEAVTDTYSYDAYGVQLYHIGTSENPFLYRGEQYDRALDSYYLRARYYQPATGRFLTTDSLEGVSRAPITQHRYVYANNDPLHFLDPSGKMSFTEQLVTAGIIGNLAMMPIGYATNLGQHFVTELAKNVFPEAYIVGFNFTGTVPFPYSFFLEELSYEFNDLWPEPPSVDGISILGAPYLHGTVGAGREYLLSVGSGEIALFDTRTLGGTLALPTFSFGIELYDGFVYNLWNTRDYTGPFGSISLNWGKDRPGLTLFWDALRGFNGGTEGNGGPWGAARTIFSKSDLLSWNYSAMWSNINYTPVGKPQEKSRSEVISRICKTILVTKAIEALTRVSVIPAAFSVLEVTTWINIGIAHHAWNQLEPEYNLRTRRKDPRPDEYHSGPYHWLF